MAFTLMPLPYDAEAIAPAITAETFSYHHGKHHQAYVTKTNDAIAGTDHADKSLEEIIAASRGTSAGLFNNSAQVWNHGFFWHSLTPTSTGPSGDLADKIEESFGSLEELKSQLKAKGAGHFASGWVWLVEQDGKLAVVDTHDADTAADQEMNPLLVIDLWEHAYYLDHQNARPSYLDAVVDGHLNWDFAADNLARGTTWVYPA
ncbi:superoxide dismutase [Erythrobacter sp. EC-HK427]|uniref:superoxide dismutase n=1 Tax=Erythrobacter sp. EC-HK427 TaxID=2038396 RepID=UPI0012537945|nr:superoxide dismutase [Erythrobacter sp. EC-HK427]VVS99099.1 superoxide dismutase, Fe [Erythrobacter sp. EC-HK427]